MIGKLYVLSLFYMVCVTSISPASRCFTTISDIVSSNAQPLQPDERPTTFISTLTVPTEAMVMYTRTRDARVGGVASGEIVAAECGPARTVEFAV